MSMKELIEQMWIAQEREAFEKWMAQSECDAQRLASAITSFDGRHYHDDEVQRAWHVWQARARIERDRDRVKICCGIPASWCNYTAVCGSVCNKCGKVHWPRRDHG